MRSQQIAWGKDPELRPAAGHIPLVLPIEWQERRARSSYRAKGARKGRWSGRVDSSPMECRGLRPINGSTGQRRGIASGWGGA